MFVIPADLEGLPQVQGQLGLQSEMLSKQKKEIKRFTVLSYQVSFSTDFILTAKVNLHLIKTKTKTQLICRSCINIHKNTRLPNL